MRRLLIALLAAATFGSAARAAGAESLAYFPASPSAEALAPVPDNKSTLMLCGAYLGASIATLMIFPPRNWSGGNQPQAGQFRRSWTEPPTWNDGDPWTTNYVGHPLMGSFLYLFARRNNHTPEMSLVTATVMSTTWEYGLESWFEQPSATDLIVTPTAGALIGEGRWQAREALLEDGTPGPLGQVGLFFADPIAEIEILYHAAGGSDDPHPAIDRRTDVFVYPGRFIVAVRF